jgi:microcystin-dependent protein
MAILGTVKLVGYRFTPRDYAPCDGQLLPISNYTALFSILGTSFGGDGRTTFGLPNLQTRVPVHVAQGARLGDQGGQANVVLSLEEMPQHSHPLAASSAGADSNDPNGALLGASPRGAAFYAPLSAGQMVDMREHAMTDSTGGGGAHENMQPYVTMSYVIALQGVYPSRGGGWIDDGDEDYIADIKPYGFNFVPRNWASCDGQLLPINQYQALFSLIGTTYGGDGRTTFALPDLRGRVPVGMGSFQGIEMPIGQAGGRENVTLSAAEIPNHDHQCELVDADGSSADPAGNMLAAKANAYTDGALDATLGAATVGEPVPNGQPHDNMMPFLTVNYCICLNGLFPSRS